MGGIGDGGEGGEGAMESREKGRKLQPKIKKITIKSLKIRI